MTVARRTVFTPDERRALLDEFFEVGARLDALPATMAPDPADLARYAELRRTYRERLPVLPLGRCPLTRAMYEHSIDPFGLDGLWWDYRSPNRPLEWMRGTVLAFTGALRMGDPVERMPFLVRPGPGAPFVVPRILKRAGVRAVLYALPIGVHTGYAITYFADPAPDDLEGFNDWGTDFYQFESDTDRLGWDQGSADAADHDFDLTKYLECGQLLWIAPGDATMELHEGVMGCPYIDLEGSRLTQLVQDGERWFDELLVDDDVSPSPPPAPAPPPPAVSPRVACTACAAELKPTSKFCPGCGKPVAAVSAVVSPITPAAALCAHCGEPRRPGATFCRSCGKP